MGTTSRTSSFLRNHSVHSAWCLSRRSARAYKIWCQRRSRSQQATGRSPPRAAHRLARTRRSSRCHRPRRTPARGEIPGGLEARRRVAQAARERAKTAPRRTRRQAAATAPWLSHAQFTRVGRISLKPTRRRLGAPETGGPSTQWLWLTCPASPLEPLGPTQGSARQLNFFRILSLSCGAPLRNRTVDLLLTMDARPVWKGRAGSRQCSSER